MTEQEDGLRRWTFKTLWVTKDQPGKKREKFSRKKYRVCGTRGLEKLAGVWKLAGSEESSGSVFGEDLSTVLDAEQFQS